jgi:hypothetical protein
VAGFSISIELPLRRTLRLFVHSRACLVQNVIQKSIVKIIIKEKSFIAYIAAKILQEKKMAVTIGRTIHLWNAREGDLIENKRWLRHELIHVQQFMRIGFLKFLFLYLWESLKKGYLQNKFEIEARTKENENISFASFDFI